MKKVIYIIVVLLLCSTGISQKKYSLYAPKDVIELAPKIALSQVGVREVGNNSGERVERYLASVGLKKGNPYCASGIYWSWATALDSLGYGLESMPLPRTGLAYGMYLYAKTHGKLSPYKAAIADCIDWRYPGKSSGHIEIIVKLGDNGWVNSVGFNSGGRTGRDGQGVHLQTRNIYLPLHRMQIMGLIGFKWKM